MRFLKKRKCLHILCAACLLAAMLFLFPQGACAEERTALDGIYVNGISVGGMTESQINETLNAYVSEIASSTIQIAVGDRTAQFTASETGIAWSNPEIVSQIMNTGTVGNVLQRFRAKNKIKNSENINYTMTFTVDATMVNNVVQTYAVPLDYDATDCTVEMLDSGPQVSSGTEGHHVNQEAAAASITDYMVNTFRGGEGYLELAYDVQQPGGNAEQLATMTDLLGYCETDFTGSIEGRITNLHNGVDKINGTIVYPGETFSVLDHVTPFTEENGYALSTAYENGTVIPDIGGGICQVSSTLYGAVLYAELEVVERSEHSMVVGYVEPSMDAAISEGSKDFVFRNNLDEPIYIYGYYHDSIIGFAIYGHETRSGSRVVSFDSVVTSETEVTTEIYGDYDQPLGYVKQSDGHMGRTAELYKVVTEDGVEVSREKINSSIYTMGPTTIDVGLSTDNAEAQAAMLSAIASGDGSAIDAVLAQYGITKTSGS